MVVWLGEVAWHHLQAIAREAEESRDVNSRLPCSYFHICSFDVCYEIETETE